jgi:hypothetical protein
MKLRSNIEVMLAVVVLIGAVVALLAAAYELYFGGRIVVAEDRASVFNSEYAAAYEGALNRPPVPPLASIETGEPVAVIWDTYGKDYWACYVRTSKGVRGWALCTSLRMVT